MQLRLSMERPGASPRRSPDPSDVARPAALSSGAPGRGAGPADLSEVPVAGLTRRRMLVIATLLAVGWLAFVFVRQVGDVTAASARAAGLRASNAELVREIAALEDELGRIVRQEHVSQAARAHGLGGPYEVLFTLEQPAPSLGPDAPGSAGTRVGASDERRSPLDAWLTVLFGPG